MKLKSPDRKTIFLLTAISIFITAWISVLYSVNAAYLNATFDAPEKSVEIYDPQNLKTNGYSVNGNSFTVISEDPQMIFSAEHTINGMLIRFEKPIAKDTSLTVYYETDRNIFDEKYTIRNVIPAGSKEFNIDSGKLKIKTLRFDIDGNFTLKSIILYEIDEGPYNIMNVWMILEIFVLVFGVVFALYWWNSKPRSPNKLTGFELGYCVLCALFYFAWAASKSIYYAPDETMRYDLSWFIFENNRLPQGEETCHPMWGFSYAHLPTILCNVLSYIPMKFISQFTDDSFSLLVAARFVSVICGAVTVYFVIKISKLMIKKPFNWIMIVLVSMLPQVAFLSSYVNNDIIALMGGAIILYSWCRAYKDRMDTKTCVIMGVGVVVCALSYYNSYGWILMSVVLFVSYYIIHKDERKKFGKNLALIVGIVVVGAGFFFIRHLVLYGDLLGFKTTHYYGELFAPDGMKPSQRLSMKTQGVSFFGMLTMVYYEMNWIEMSVKSFVECFGAMGVWGHSFVYMFYGIMISGAFCLCIIYYLIKIRKFSVRYLYEKRNKIVFAFCLLCSVAIPVILSMINSYGTDYQPQGRYFIGSLLGVALITAKAFEIGFGKIKKISIQNACVCILCSVMVFVMLREFVTVYLPS